METMGKDILQFTPTTRYQGSKRKILPWLYENFKDLEFSTVLDGFGGTGSVSYLLKLMGKQVTFNDIMPSNHIAGISLIENDSVKLAQEDIDFVLHKNGFKYRSFIRDTFRGIYYREDENDLLDVMALNIKMLSEKYEGEVLTKKQALSYYILFQSCLCKRPFNLFHRKNLSLRTSRGVERTFGNKKTWDTSFKKLLLKFNEEVSQKIFSNELKNKALCKDIFKINNTNFDLVYLDPPYARADEKKPKDYHSLYHFLDGLTDYDNWGGKIDSNTKNKRLLRENNSWDSDTLENNFDALFNKFQDSIIVLSYGEPGYPSIAKIKELLSQYKTKVHVVKKEYKYRLNRRNGHGLYEVLIIGQ